MEERIKKKDNFSRLILLALGIIAAIFPVTIFGTVFSSGKMAFAKTIQGFIESFQIMTIFYFVVFMPLIAFMLVLAVPVYVVRLKTIDIKIKIGLMALIVVALVFVGLQFMQLNMKIDFVRQLYSYPSVWIYSWLVHVAILALVISPLIFEEEALFVSLIVSLIVIIISAYSIGYRYLVLIRTITKT